MSVREIEAMVAALPPEELDEFARWFDDYLDAEHPPPPDISWDDYMVEIRRRSAEIDAGTATCSTLDEVLRRGREGVAGQEHV